MTEGNLNDIASAKAVRAAEKAAKEHLRQQEADVKEILKTEGGRRFFYKYLCRCGVFESNFDRDSHVTAFYEGERKIGLDLFADMNRADPEAFIKMHREAEYDKELKKEHEEEASKKNKEGDDAPQT
jgi:hypothetical protein